MNLILSMLLTVVMVLTGSGCSNDSGRDSIYYYIQDYENGRINLND